MIACFDCYTELWIDINLCPKDDGVMDHHDCVLCQCYTPTMVCQWTTKIGLPMDHQDWFANVTWDSFLLK